MADLDVEVVVAELNDADSKQAVDIRIAQHEYPDLKVFRDSQGLIRQYTSAVNEKVDQIAVITAAGNVIMMPYLTEKEYCVFSNPPEVVVGRVVEAGFGVTPEPGWEEILEANKIPRKIILGIKDYLFKNRPVLW